MATLMDLPAELHLEIAHLLPPKDYLELMLAKKKLYSNLKCDVGKSIEKLRAHLHKLWDIQLSCRYAWKLQDEILKDEHFASNVDEFTIAGKDDYRHWNGVLESVYITDLDRVPSERLVARYVGLLLNNDFLFSTIKNEAQRLCEKAELAGRIEQGAQEAIRADLLTRLPNLKQLSIATHKQAIWAWRTIVSVSLAHVERFRQTSLNPSLAFSNNLPLSKLVQVRIGGGMPYFESVQWMHHVLQIPSLKQFIGAKLWDDGTPFYRTIETPSGLRTLVLADCQIGHGSMLQELKRMTSLEQFYYCHTDCTGWTYATGHVMEQLKKSAAHSLKTLILGHRTANPTFDMQTVLRKRCLENIWCHQRNGVAKGRGPQDEAYESAMIAFNGSLWNETMLQELGKCKEWTNFTASEALPILPPEMFSSFPLVNLSTFTNLETLICEWRDLMPFDVPVNLTSILPKSLKLLAIKYCPPGGNLQVIEDYINAPKDERPCLEEIYVGGGPGFCVSGQPTLHLTELAAKQELLTPYEVYFQAAYNGYYDPEYNQGLAQPVRPRYPDWIEVGFSRWEWDKYYNDSYLDDEDSSDEEEESGEETSAADQDDNRDDPDHDEIDDDGDEEDEDGVEWDEDLGHWVVSDHGKDDEGNDDAAAVTSEHEDASNTGGHGIDDSDWDSLYT